MFWRQPHPDVKQACKKESINKFMSDGPATKNIYLSDIVLIKKDSISISHHSVTIMCPYWCIIFKVEEDHV